MFRMYFPLPVLHMLFSVGQDVSKTSFLNYTTAQPPWTARSFEEIKKRRTLTVYNYLHIVDMASIYLYRCIPQFQALVRNHSISISGNLSWKKKKIIIIIIIILSSYMCRSKVWLVVDKMVSALFEQLYMDQWIHVGSVADKCQSWFNYAHLRYWMTNGPNYTSVQRELELTNACKELQVYSKHYKWSRCCMFSLRGPWPFYLLQLTHVETSWAHPITLRLPPSKWMLSNTFS